MFGGEVLLDEDEDNGFGAAASANQNKAKPAGGMFGGDDLKEDEGKAKLNSILYLKYV